MFTQCGSKLGSENDVQVAKERKSYVSPSLKKYGNLGNLTNTGSRGGSDAMGSAGMMV